MKEIISPFNTFSNCNILALFCHFWRFEFIKSKNSTSIKNSLIITQSIEQKLRYIWFFALLKEAHNDQKLQENIKQGKKQETKSLCKIAKKLINYLKKNYETTKTIWSWINIFEFASFSEFQKSPSNYIFRRKCWVVKFSVKRALAVSW